jgi:PTH1 family peptidyl-tRNA hydrolase
VIQRLGTQEFPRQRIGVARPVQAVRDIASHVLGVFSADEQVRLNEVLKLADQQILCWIEDNIAKAMSLHNRSQ